MNNILDAVKKVHFVGIGGIGISAIARLMHLKGTKVSGSDISHSIITVELEKVGVPITIGHRSENIPEKTDLVIYTIAVSDDNPELVFARENNIRTLTYPQTLSIISEDLETIAISGTHGKTTTTAMLAKVCIDAGLDPTVIVGSLMKDLQSNLCVGRSKYFIVEACEYRRSFLNLNPTILVITNIDADHLDYYEDMHDIQLAFRELALKVPFHGAVICNATDPLLEPILSGLICPIIDYTKYMDTDLKLNAPGIHNTSNAAAVGAVADILNLDKKNTQQSLENFTGTWRRFDLHGTTKRGALIYDDYAHHPKEIKATLAGLKEKYPGKKRIAFFQPHQFSRTKLLLQEFSEAFSDVDLIYIFPIYPAREVSDLSINSSMLVGKIKENGKDAHLVESFEVGAEIMNSQNDSSVVITMGAGDVYKVTEMISYSA